MSNTQTIGPDYGPGPDACQGQLGTLRASAALTAAWVESDIISVLRARRVTLWIAINGAASESNAQVGFNVWLSGQTTQPAVGDDSWYAPAILDAVATDGTLSGSRPSGWDPTDTPSFRSYVIGPASFKSFVLTASTNKIRLALPIDVTGAKWMHIQCIELGDTSHPCVMGVDYTLSL